MVCIDDAKVFELSTFGNENGKLAVFENSAGLSFNIVRIFYIFGVNTGEVRGNHANKYSDFFMMCVCGSCKVSIKDYNGNETTVVLDKPNKGLLIPALLWKKMYDFSPDAVLLVLSNKHYDPNEYYKDYSLFCKEMKEKGC